MIKLAHKLGLASWLAILAQGLQICNMATTAADKGLCLPQHSIS